MTLPRLKLTVLGAALLMAACGGDDPTGPDVETPGEGARVVKDNPAFVADIYEILTRRGCTSSGCHGGSAGGLTLTSAATSYTSLVGPVSSRTGETLVIPGDAGNSYLMKKLLGSPGIEGERMPRGGAALDDIDMGNMRNWINTGAPNN